MYITKNGHVVEYDTTRRTKYTEKDIQRVLDLRLWGLSLREISGNTRIPSSSVRNILVRERKLYYDTTSRAGLHWLNREMCREYYEMSDSQFDYVKQAYPSLTKKINYTRYIHMSYINDYMDDKKAYKERYKNDKRKSKPIN